MATHVITRNHLTCCDTDRACSCTLAKLYTKIPIIPCSAATGLICRSWIECMPEWVVEHGGQTSVAGPACSGC